MDVVKVLLVLTMNTIFPIYITKIELFLDFETKSSLSTSVFICTTISKILKRKFYLFFKSTTNMGDSIHFTFRNIVQEFEKFAQK